jgi:acyl-CoA thioester hydrolase
MPALTPYRVRIEPEWIDYNGHVRDAYYALAASLASDAMMLEVGMDEAYRTRTQCTLYTLEMHVHYLREVKHDDELSVAGSILDCDAKRIHFGCRFVSPRVPEGMATAEMMLLHVHQGETPASRAFPEEIQARLAPLKTTPAALAAFTPAAGKIAIKRR